MDQKKVYGIGLAIVLNKRIKENQVEPFCSLGLGYIYIYVCVCACVCVCEVEIPS